MENSTDRRTSERVRLANKAKVVANGRFISSVIAINLSVSGLLLAPVPKLPVGSICEVEMPNALGGLDALTGKVLRSDPWGTAIQFTQNLDELLFARLAQAPKEGVIRQIFHTYITYFQASQTDNSAKIERLLGVTRPVFLRVFLVSFTSSIALAILSIWFFRSQFLPFPNWMRVTFCVGYGFLWLGLIQPVIDISVFRFLRRKSGVGRTAPYAGSHNQ